MPVSLSLHRQSVGMHQNNIYRNAKTKKTSFRETNSGHDTNLPKYEFCSQITHAAKSDKIPKIPTWQQRSFPHNPIFTAIGFMFLFNQIQSVSAASSPVDGRALLGTADAGRTASPYSARQTARSYMTIGEDHAIYDRTGSFRAPGIDATMAQASDTGIITYEKKSHRINSDFDAYVKSESIIAPRERLISGGKVRQGGDKEIESALPSSIDTKTGSVAHRDNDDNNHRRTKRAALSDQNPHIEKHIEEHCAFEDEILYPWGPNAGKDLLFEAQRAENPFRMIYDNADVGPTPFQRGLADGLNIVTDFLTLYIKKIAGSAVANFKRSEYFKNNGDEICA